MGSSGGLYGFASLMLGTFLGGLGHCPILPYVVVACPWDVGCFLWPIAGALLQIEHRRMSPLWTLVLLTFFCLAFIIHAWRDGYDMEMLHERCEPLAYVLFAMHLGTHALLWVLIWKKCGPTFDQVTE